MRKYLLSTLAVVALLSATAVFVAASPGTWMDMENCAVCKHLAADQELMMNISWDHYATKTGMISVTTINDGYAERFETAHAKMKTAIDKVMAGEKADMCNMCLGMGAFFQKGAEAENVKTNNGEISITSSDNAEVVAEIHAWVERTTSEMKKVHESMKMDAGK